jgi:3D (Asp-Asp-Asp) domain-containing protein
LNSALQAKFWKENLMKKSLAACSLLAMGVIAMLGIDIYSQAQTTQQNPITRNSTEVKVQEPKQNETIKTVTTPGVKVSKKNTTMKSVTRTSAGSFKATAYCLRGRTANGGGVRRGIVAADPRVIPLGSTIRLTAGSYSGIYRVTDTGGAIKGRILDVWVPSCGEAIRFGRRTVYVSVVGR